MGILLIGIGIMISAVLITQKMNSGKEKNDLFVAIIIGMWAIVLLVLAVMK